MYSENSKIVTCLDSFSQQIYDIWVTFCPISVFVKFGNLQYFPLASFSRSYRFTDDAFIAET